jgi:hypothetical protein
VWEFHIKVCAEGTLQDEQRLHAKVKRATILEVHGLAILAESSVVFLRPYRKIL